MVERKPTGQPRSSIGNVGELLAWFLHLRTCFFPEPPSDYFTSRPVDVGELRRSFLQLLQLRGGRYRSLGVPRAQTSVPAALHQQVSVSLSSRAAVNFTCRKQDGVVKNMKNMRGSEPLRLKRRAPPCAVCLLPVRAVVWMAEIDLKLKLGSSWWYPIVYALALESAVWENSMGLHLVACG